jgi:formylglycine-generating enzyme required for sulfatase activity
MANTWQGHFPYQNAGAAGWVGTSPVESFPANGFGLSDTIGNVWGMDDHDLSGPARRGIALLRSIAGGWPHRGTIKRPLRP